MKRTDYLKLDEERKLTREERKKENKKENKKGSKLQTNYWTTIINLGSENEPYLQITFEDKTQPTQEIPLKEVNEDFILKERERFLKELPEENGLIIKYYDKLYFSLVPSEYNLKETIPHLCDRCHRLYALPFEKGGCEKVSNYDYYRFGDSGGIKVKIEDSNSKRIEKYKFITFGLEVLSLSSTKECFLVCSCTNFC